MPKVIVLLDNLQKSFEIPENVLVYDEIENQGLSLPAGCLAGSCGTCRVEVLKGDEFITAPSAIEKNTIDAISNEYQGKKKIRLTCRMKISRHGEIIISPLKK